MVFGDPEALDAAKYKDQELFNRFLSGDDLVDLGIVPIRPKPDPGRFSPGTVQAYGTREGTNVSRTKISPSQRDVVAKYFAE